MKTQPRSTGRRRALHPKAHGAKPNGRDARGDRIRYAIERDILSGKIGPGTKLDEDALAVRHGVSRTPVREALRHLASQGLIELRRHSGAFVKTLTVVELAEMFETMAFLEAACAALASRRHTMSDRRALEAAHRECARAAKKANADAFYLANARFHESIYAASHNHFIASQTVALRNRLEAYRREATFHPGFMALTMKEHRQILDAIFTMDEAAAARCMRNHLDTLREDAISVAMAMPKTAAQ